MGFLMQSVLIEKKIVLCVCGGIAAYKSVELLRLFQESRGGCAGGDDTECGSNLWGP